MNIISNNYLYFKLGHATIGMALQLLNFVIIADTLLLNRIIPIPIYYFAIAFISAYALVCIVIGRIQLHKQLPTDQIRVFENNPLLIKLELLKIKMLSGKASEKEIKEMLDYLERLNNAVKP